jgi:tubulin delta
LVDTEPKILKPLLEDRKRFSFIDLKNIMFYQYGRGNNWGLGYMDTVKHKHLSAMRIKNQQNFDLMKDTELS